MNSSNFCNFSLCIVLQIAGSHYDECLCPWNWYWTSDHGNQLRPARARRWSCRLWDVLASNWSHRTLRQERYRREFGVGWERRDNFEKHRKAFREINPASKFQQFRWFGETVLMWTKSQHFYIVRILFRYLCYYIGRMLFHIQKEYKLCFSHMFMF